jgi:hypothetical protein
MKATEQVALFILEHVKDKGKRLGVFMGVQRKWLDEEICCLGWLQHSCDAYIKGQSKATGNGGQEKVINQEVFRTGSSYRGEMMKYAYNLLWIQASMRCITAT